MTLAPKFSKKRLSTCLMSFTLFSVTGCQSIDYDNNNNHSNTAANNQLNTIIANFKQGTSLPFTVLDDSVDNGLKSGQKMQIRNGGYGSDAAAHPTNTRQFYALTDRGPNAKFNGSIGNGKKFPTPDYTPRIGLFELQDDGSIAKVKEILLKDTQGYNISGLPNSANLGGTGETAYDKYGKPILVNPNKPYDKTTNPIKTDNFGLDGEGLVALKDGSFWVSDEYGPHMVHFDKTGREINRINAFTSDNRNNLVINGKAITLPAEFANRRPNRGMEGLAITPDETTLVGIMQSTLDNPTKAVRKQNITRIVTVNLVTGEIAQYLYQQEKTQNSNSGIVALDNSHFLVIERDGGFEGKKPGAQKHIYKISLDNATNIEAIAPTADMDQDDKLGLTINGKTLEQVVTDSKGSWNTLTTHGIKPVSKALVLDAVKQFHYPHDKLEGMWLMGDGRLGLINDDDFATWSTDGVLEQKYLDNAMTDEDSNRLYIATGLDY